MFKKIKSMVVALLALALGAISQVALAVDSAEVVAAKAQITQTQTDWTSIAGMLLLMAVAVWGIMKLVGIFKGR
jgi:uncharacterized membrane protein